MDRRHDPGGSEAEVREQRPRQEQARDQDQVSHGDQHAEGRETPGRGEHAQRSGRPPPGTQRRDRDGDGAGWGPEDRQVRSVFRAPHLSLGINA